MGIIDTLKWMWDPRNDKQKSYDKWDSETPMQRRVQRLRVYIRDEAEPILTDYVQTDWKMWDDTMRWASNKDTFDGLLRDWLMKRGVNGIQIDDVWYSPESIVRIELGEQVAEDI